MSQSTSNDLDEIDHAVVWFGMLAPDRFVAWMRNYIYFDVNRRLPEGLRLQYHARSDEHSKVMANLMVEDLVLRCQTLRHHAASGQVVFGINYRYTWSNGKSKTLDLAIGIPSEPIIGPGDGYIVQALPNSRLKDGVKISRILVCCELKAVMTEHKKSQPRVYSELNDAHTIPHTGSKDIIAAGLATINTATTFISALRQRPGKDVETTSHDQPRVAAEMVRHLRGLPVRTNTEGVGLDAFSSILIDADNQGHVSLETGPPAPQPGEADHYETFLGRICALYNEYFHDLNSLAEEKGISMEEALRNLATAYPNSLTRIGALGVAEVVPGADEIEAVLQSIDVEAGNLPGEQQET